MKLAILGGSFNPIHIGHLFLADTVLTELQYDRVILIPAYRSPFKLAAAGMEESSGDRLEMIAASIAGNPGLTVDDCEIRREGISYTVDTVADIIRRYNPDGKPGLIIGNDLSHEFPNWHRSSEILEMADIIIARRVHDGGVKVSYPNIQIENNIIDIGSGMVRERINSGGAWRYLVPAAAAAIIEERRLFGFDGDPENNEDSAKSFILCMEDTARSSLSIERFLHSRNTALMAWDLCQRFKSEHPSLDPMLGYLAGITHDLCKEKEKSPILHGKAAAVLLKERFNVNNKDVLEAVALHTSAGENMCPLAKVIYAADKIEVSRGKTDSVRKKILDKDSLDKIFFSVFSMNVKKLLKKNLELSEETMKLIAEINESKNNADKNSFY